MKIKDVYLLSLGTLCAALVACDHKKPGEETADSSYTPNEVTNTVSDSSSYSVDSISSTSDTGTSDVVTQKSKTMRDSAANYKKQH